MPESWRKSSRCGANGTCVEVAEWRTACSNEANCVEVGHGGGVVAVRDSADPGGPVLALSPHGFARLLTTIKETPTDG